MSMRVSIVTPSFNMKPYLAQTIDSVLSELKTGDEYFVVDGSSTDGSAELIASRGAGLSGWVSEPDQGYADALAKGFARASGDVLCWINAGDLLLPGALDAARDALDRGRADFIFGDDFYIDEEGRVIFLSRGYVRDLRAAMLYGGWTPLQDACFWRRSLYDRVGGLDPALQYAADFDLFLRMSLAGTSVYVPKAFSAFRRHAGQKSIAGSSAYRAERERVRRRELARVAQPLFGKVLRQLEQGIAVRWSTRIAQSGRRRNDLEGHQIRGLRCATYWPPGIGVA